MKMNKVVGSPKILKGLTGALLLAVWAVPSFALVTDEALCARAEYYAMQSAKRREAERLRKLEEESHKKELNVNEVLKVIADSEDQIKEVVIIYKTGLPDRYIARVEEVETPPAEQTKPTSVTKQENRFPSPFFNERGGRQPVW